MLTLKQTTKANKRANRIITNLRLNRGADLGYPIEWFIEEGSSIFGESLRTKSISPESILGAVLLMPNEIHNVMLSTIQHTGARREWETVTVELDNRINRCHEREQENNCTDPDNTTTRILNQNRKKMDKLYKTDSYVPHLVTRGVLPVDITAIMTMIQNNRSRVNRRSIRNHEMSWSSKVEEFKESWTSMQPNRVKRNFLPKGTAIGVEIEWLARAQECEDHHDGYDRHCMDFEKPHPPIHGVQWAYDTSINVSEDYHYESGQETKLLLRYGKWNRLYKICKHIREQGGEVNRSCGLHVHLDVRDLNKASTITRCRRLESALPWLLKIIPPTRAAGNTYCAPSFSQNDKYHAITMHSFRRQRESIEVRCHSATLNPKKIIQWVELLMFLKESYKHYPTFESFINSMAPYELKEYVIKRKTKFKPREETPEEEQDSDSEQLVENVPAATPPLPPLPDRS